MATRIRRNRPQAALANLDDEIDELLKSIAADTDVIDEHNIAIAQRQVAIKEASDRLFALMQASGKKTIMAHGFVADVIRPVGRASNVIDPRGYRKLVSEKDFYESISVSVTKAKAYVPAKQLATVTHTVEGTVGEPALKVSRWTGKK